MAPPADRRLASPDGRAVWDATDRQRAYVAVNTPATRAVWGLVGGRRFDLGGVRFELGQLERDYAVLVLTSLDGQPIESSARLLLAAVGSAQNRNLGWNDERNSVGNQWGTGPAQVNRIAAAVELPCGIRRVRALDGRGQPQDQVPLDTRDGAGRLSIGPQHRTLWYEIETAGP